MKTKKLCKDGACWNRGDQVYCEHFYEEETNPKNWDITAPFNNDTEKMRDFNNLTKEEFLKSYSYINETSYDMTFKAKCIYCDNTTTDDTRHFESQCCGRGMCEECYDALIGTDEQLQVEHYNDEENIIKPEYQDATYLCFDCGDIWKIKE
jgi:hypothetical protein